MTDYLPGTQGIPLPPPNLMFMGEDHQSMLRNGAYMLQFPKEVGFYDPDTTLLDVGCGYGRLAYALIKEGHRGAYTGMDILRPQISWLNSNLLAFLPQGSSFLHLDIHNQKYNPAGAIQARNVTLPSLVTAPRAAFLFSVFTHMYADDIDGYLRELRRTLRLGTKICITFFLINDEMRHLEREGRSQYPLQFRESDSCYFFSKTTPLHAIGYDEAWVRERLQVNGYSVEHCSYGFWCGRKQTKTHQDTIIARTV
jgi:SAM-dependent methyltransferase